MKTHPPVAFVLNLFDTGLAAVRSLGRRGIPVVGVDFTPTHAGFSTRYGRTLLAPDPVNESEALLERLLAEGRKLDQPGVLIPASDAYALFVSRNREALSEVFRFNLPDAPLLEALINKRETCELAVRVGTRIPTTFYPQTLAEVEAIAGQLDYPAILKPLYGHLWRASVNNLKAIKVDSSQELLERYAEVAPTGQPVLVQSVILGPTENLMQLCAYLDGQGEPLGLFSFRKLRQCPPEFGVGSLVESVRDIELIAEGLHFLRAIGYRGMACVEFKRDSRDGRLKLIELNPRLGQQTRLAMDCGIDMPLIQYRDLIGDPLAARVHFSTGVRWLDAVGDFESVQELGLSPRQWLGDWMRARSFAKFDWADPGPFLQANEWGRSYLRQIRRKLPRPRPHSWPPSPTQLSDA